MLATEHRPSLAGREEDGVLALEVERDSLRIELLGRFRIAYGDAEILDDGWRLVKARSLVKIVALSPGLSIHREQLIDQLWPDLDPGAGANNLHQVLHVARRTLAGLFPDVKPNEVLRLQHGSLSLAPPVPVWIDVVAFEEATSTLRDSSDPAGYYAALDLYQGDLLPDDLYEDWADERRIALKERYLSALNRLARLHYSRREAAPAIDALRRIVANEPDREDAHRKLMELYALTGRRQQALRQYERLREILARELDTRPQPETEKLYRAIEAGDFPAEAWDETRPEPVTTPPREQPRPEPAQTEPVRDFVGRDTELSRLTVAFQRSVAGRGEIVLIAGEPGIGKTRMIEEFTRFVASQGVATLWGSAYEGDGAPAYWPWVRIIRDYIDSRDASTLRAVMGPGAADIARIVPELRRALPDLEEPPPLDPDGERFRLFDSLTTFFQTAAGREPVILVLDDLQWADRSSLALLEFLAREVSQTRLFIIATYRHVEVERGHPLLHSLGELARHEQGERITLEGLTTDQIDRYIALATGQDAPEGLAAAIHLQTGGNPFFVREIVRLLIDEQRLDRPEDVRSWRLTIPPGIRETIALRTDHLSDVALKALTIASVSGRDFELPVVSRVANLDEMDALDAFEDVLHTGLIEELPDRPGTFRFAHAIVRETLYDTISQARRLRLHLRTGEAIEEVAGTEIDAHLPELAHHYYIAAPLGVEDRAIDYLTRAGELAMTQTAYAEAATRYQQALELFDASPEADSRETGRLLIRLSECQRYAGDPEAAIETLHRALEIARQHGFPDLLAQSAIGLSEAAYQHGDVRATYVPVLKEVHEALGDLDAVLQIRILSRIAQDLAITTVDISDALEQAQEASKQALDIADAIQNPELRVLARLGRQHVLWIGDDEEERQKNLSDLVELVDDCTDRRHLLMFHSFRMSESMVRGDMDSLLHDMEAYERHATALRQPHNLWVSSFRRTMHALLVGDFTTAEELTNRTYALGQRPAPTQALEVYLKHIALIRIEQDRAAEVLDLANEIAGRYPKYSEQQLIRCLILAVEGSSEEPADLLEALARSGFAEIPRNRIWTSNAAFLAMLSSEISHQNAARKLYPLLLPYKGQFLSGGGDTVGFGAASHYLGILAATSGDYSCAIEHLVSAIDQNAALGARALTARSRFALATSLFEANGIASNPKITDLLAQAGESARSLGMSRLERQIAELKSKAGV